MKQKFKDVWHLVWIYNRMINIKEENPSVDYMRTFYAVIMRRLAELELPIQLLTNPSTGSLSFEYEGEQP